MTLLVPTTHKSSQASKLQLRQEFCIKSWEADGWCWEGQNTQDFATVIISLYF